MTLLSSFSYVSIIFLLFLQTCSAKHHPSCAPSSCGKIHNITYPFRLKGDPQGCGLQRYELDCINNIAVFTLFSGKYHVQEINYIKYQIRLTDAGVMEDACSFPHYFLYSHNFSFIDIPYYSTPDVLTFPDMMEDLFVSYPTIAFLNCSNQVTNDPRYVEMDTHGCNSKGHIYAIQHDNNCYGFSLMDIKVGCSLKVATFANYVKIIKLSENSYSVEMKDGFNVSSYKIQKWLKEGFWLSWLVPIICRDKCGKDVKCVMDETTQEVQCDHHRYCHYVTTTSTNCGMLPRIHEYIISYFHGIMTGLWSRITFRTIEIDGFIAIYIGRNVLPIFIVARYLFGVVFLFGLLIYRWHRRHLSLYENIEWFLLDNNLNPIRYEYGEIKRMTRSFRVKLGEGGFGSVYKGKLRSGSNVAIKMLNNSKSIGQEFINEVATIGRIHHINVVRLVGYCVEGKKRALVYEYMPNGSLDKFIFSKEGSVPLSYSKAYEISLGIAHGIAYLHQGCDIQILHFDIKPHNILLDDNFIPKVSDFGLAKLYPINDSIVTLTAARGTLGYMAPELFYKNIGGVSYKVDVYSFGMLLMEMTSRRRNTNLCEEHSSQHYFPLWIYDQFKEEKYVDMEDASEGDKVLTKKMFLIALWCIQLKPRDRPSIKEVVEMLEGEIESIEMPPRPSFYPHEMSTPNDIIKSDQETWSDTTSFNTYHDGD
ncbi:hypothetical protein VNO78_21344 [Psophocarpus tetragonolobus]|uniref:Protein kinase domain-containing protein n=1 Tax=Psophocarpus tetragonolobus TaxID=3891 RepID=A0AAN9SCM5_PSOTE